MYRTFWDATKKTMLSRAMVTSARHMRKRSGSLAGECWSCSFLRSGFISAPYGGGPAHTSHSYIYYHISQRGARKQPDLWTDIRANKHALRRRVPSASAEFASDRMRNGPEVSTILSREDRYLPTSTDDDLVAIVAEQGKRAQKQPSIDPYRYW